MERFLTFVYQGSRGTVTASGFVHWKTLSCDRSCLVGSLRDMVEATLYRLGV